MTVKVPLVDVLTNWRYVTLEQWATAIDLFDVAVQVGFATSKSHARRLHEQGGLRLNGTKTNDPTAYVMFAPGNDPITVNTRHVILNLDRSVLTQHTESAKLSASNNQ